MQLRLRPQTGYQSLASQHVGPGVRMPPMRLQPMGPACRAGPTPLTCQVRLGKPALLCFSPVGGVMGRRRWEGWRPEAWARNASGRWQGILGRYHAFAGGWFTYVSENFSVMLVSQSHRHTRSPSLRLARRRCSGQRLAARQTARCRIHWVITSRLGRPAPSSTKGRNMLGLGRTCRRLPVAGVVPSDPPLSRVSLKSAAARAARWVELPLVNLRRFCNVGVNLTTLRSGRPSRSVALQEHSVTSDRFADAPTLAELCQEHIGQT